ncbi:MAG: FadR family transcriptional regulator [Candidatus Accumulibacter sp.]|nr:FadR family transcriptional regulator [Accumulibacter sp.]
MVMQSVTERAQKAIEVHLVDGSWPVGMRLPPERVMADELGVSRNSVREAISRLKERGLLFSKPGCGVFVSNRLQGAISSPWRQLVAAQPDLRWDTLEFRRELEGATAYFAALRADAADLKKIEEAVIRLLAACRSGQKEEEYRADADFHELIAEASHNSMFLYLHSGIVRMLREHISLNIIGLEDPSGEMTERLCRQHLEIWEAIRTHRPEDARRAMLAHINFTWAELARRSDDDSVRLP